MADNDKQKNSDSRSTFGTQVSKLNFFKTSKIFPYSLPSLGLVVQDLVQAFENEAARVWDAKQSYTGCFIGRDKERVEDAEVGQRTFRTL